MKINLKTEYMSVEIDSNREEETVDDALDIFVSALRATGYQVNRDEITYERSIPAKLTPAEEA